MTDAEEIFSRRMGDQVDSCREFIEKNIFDVTSLDIRPRFVGVGSCIT